MPAGEGGGGGGGGGEDTRRTRTIGLSGTEEVDRNSPVVDGINNLSLVVRLASLS